MARFDDSWRRADTVIVGGGTSGPAVAGLLAEGTDERVLVLEAGPDYGARGSGRWPAELLDARGHADQPRLGVRLGRALRRSGDPVRPRPRDRRLLVAQRLRGPLGQSRRLRRLGPCRLVDRRAAAALPRGVASDVGAPRGSDSELGPYHRAVLRAAEACGIPRVADLNDLDTDVGAAPFDANIRDGIRWNAAFAYLDPVRDRPNVAILGDTIVDRVELRPGRSTRVHAIRGGQPLVLEAARVVLTAGTYGTPAILLRSGIGPAARPRAARHRGGARPARRGRQPARPPDGRARLHGLLGTGSRTRRGLEQGLRARGADAREAALVALPRGLRPAPRTRRGRAARRASLPGACCWRSRA